MKVFVHVFLLLVCLSQLSLTAQNKITLSGKVTDQQGTPLSLVTIAVENTVSGTYTDDSGLYSLQVSPGKHTFVVSSLGYQTIKTSLDLHHDKTLDFKLEESSVNISPVEVYGKTQSQQLRESALSVNALDVKPVINSLNSLNELVNRTSGVKIREEGGVGSDFDLSINGLSGNSVRYFIDGVPLDSKGSYVTLTNLPVNLIDRVEIYKGVVPASLGTDALGGAVNIITCLIAHLHVFHPVVVFRIADTDGRTHDQSGVPFHKLCVQVGTMCMEGTDAIRSVHEAFLFCLGDNVDSSA